MRMEELDSGAGGRLALMVLRQNTVRCRHHPNCLRGSTAHEASTRTDLLGDVVFAVGAAVDGGHGQLGSLVEQARVAARALCAGGRAEARLISSLASAMNACNRPTINGQ